eukprot:1616299-Pyramimonas_sp.AAC.1
MVNHLTAAPSPRSVEPWASKGIINEVSEGICGTGTFAQPLFLSGGASGGPDTSSSLFGGVGLAVTFFRSLVPQ